MSPLFNILAIGRSRVKSDKFTMLLVSTLIFFGREVFSVCWRIGVPLSLASFCFFAICCVSRILLLILSVSCGSLCRRVQSPGLLCVVS